MLKTVLKVLAFYAILSALVSGCSLIGEYAEGVSGTASNAESPITVKSESETTAKRHEDRNKTKRARVLYSSIKAIEKTYKELLSTPNNIKYIAQGERVITLYKDLPCNLVQSAIEELKKRKKFYTFGRDYCCERDHINLQIVK